MAQSKPATFPHTHPISFELLQVKKVQGLQDSKTKLKKNSMTSLNLPHLSPLTFSLSVSCPFPTQKKVTCK